MRLSRREDRILYQASESPTCPSISAGRQCSGFMNQNSPLPSVISHQRPALVRPRGMVTTLTNRPKRRGFDGLATVFSYRSPNSGTVATAVVVFGSSDLQREAGTDQHLVALEELPESLDGRLSLVGADGLVDPGDDDVTRLKAQDPDLLDLGGQ